ncbi:hypothetical protein ACAG39_02155 [Caldicellulosiruptoraceae bacterium PP1]
MRLPEEKIKLIINKYYEEHKEMVDIAKEVGLSRQTVSKYVKQDERFEEEKKYRKSINHEKQLARVREYQKKKRKQAQNRLFDETWEIVKKQHRQAVAELSNEFSHSKYPPITTSFEFVHRAYDWIKGKFVRKDILEDGTVVPSCLPKVIKPIHSLSEGLKRKRNTVINTANNFAM